MARPPIQPEIPATSGRVRSVRDVRPPAVGRLLERLVAATVAGLTACCLVKADVFFFLAGFLPVTPAALFVAWTLPILVALPLTGGGRACLRAVRRLGPVLVPLLIVVATGLLSAAVRREADFQDLRTMWFPALAFYVFVAGLGIAIVLNTERRWKSTLTLAFVVIVATIWLDVARPYTFTQPDLVGPAGFPQNPNGGALVVLLLLAAIIDWHKPVIARTGIVAIGTLTIAATASRSGILTALTILGVYLWRMGLRRVGIVAGLAALAGVVVVLSTGAAEDALLETAQQLGLPVRKIADMMDPHGETFTLSDSSSLERLEGLEASLALIAESPFLGQGTGYSYEMRVGPHNMYVARLVDNGLIGLVVYIWLLAAVAAFNWRAGNWSGVAVAGAVALFGLFSHNLLEDRTVLLLLSITSMRAAMPVLGAPGRP